MFVPTTFYGENNGRTQFSYGGPTDAQVDAYLDSGYEGSLRDFITYNLKVDIQGNYYYYGEKLGEEVVVNGNSVEKREYYEKVYIAAEKQGGEIPSMLFGYGAEATIAFPGKQGYTGSFGQLANNGTGVNAFSTSGNAKGAEASTGVFVMFIQPVKSSFTINDVSGASVGVNVNYNIFGVSIFTNSNQSYIGLMIGIGLGIGGSYVETNTTINKVDNQLIQIQNEIYFRYAPH